MARITASDLKGFGSVIRMTFEAFFPDGVELEDLAQEDRQWLKIIYDYFKEAEDGNDHH